MLYNYEASFVFDGQLRFKFHSDKRTGFFVRVARMNYYNYDTYDYETGLRMNVGLFF